MSTKKYGMKAGLKVFGNTRLDAVASEIRDNLHRRGVIEPVKRELVTHSIRRQSRPYLMFLKQKRCGKIKGRGCADGRKRRELISKEEVSSPTVSTPALIATCLIDVIEGRNVATADIPGAFLQATIDDVWIKLVCCSRQSALGHGFDSWSCSDVLSHSLEFLIADFSFRF